MIRVTLRVLVALALLAALLAAPRASAAQEADQYATPRPERGRGDTVARRPSSIR